MEPRTYTKAGGRRSFTKRMMDRIKEITFISKNVQEEYEALSTGKFEDKGLHKGITRAMEEIKNNPLRYTRVPEQLIPEKYMHEYGIKALWKYDLPDGWRLLYTVTGNEIKIVSIILEWLDHKAYERRFSY